jgi:NAD(P)-dependent dehydrogenase (short-subunit alcohol dehydrogenase family)
MASDEIFTRIMDVNVRGTWNMSTEAILRMNKQGQKASIPGILPEFTRTPGAGRIVNFASGAGIRGIAHIAAYCASKHAVVGLTRAWAKDWPSLRINAVAPGKLNTTT